MSAIAIQSLTLSSPRVSHRFSVRSWLRDHIVALNIVSFVIIGCLVLSYIVQVNATISKGYQIRDLETQVNEYTLLNQRLELETRSAQSLDYVAQSMKMSGFVKSEMPKYISASTPSYALAE